MTQHSDGVKSVYDRFALQHTLLRDILHLYNGMNSQFDKNCTNHSHGHCLSNKYSKQYIGCPQFFFFLLFFKNTSYSYSIEWRWLEKPLNSFPTRPAQKKLAPVPLNIDSIQYYYLSSHLQNTQSTLLFTKILRFEGIFTEYDQKKTNNKT